MRKFLANGKKLIFTLIVTIIAQAAIAQTAVIQGVITDASGPLANVLVKLDGTKKSTFTDATGFYSFKVNPGAYTVVIKAGDFVEKKIEVVADAGKVAEANGTLERSLNTGVVTVVGTRSSVPRSSISTPVPVDVFSARELALTGQVEPTQMLNYVAPSFNSSRQTVADGTDHIDPATIRGLGPDQVLVLLNGRRRHTTALVNVNGTIGRGSVGTDLNSIPTSAIEKVEVLRDGAAAQYGSDAIAGVINVKLKRDIGKTSVTAHMGRQYAGDGTTKQIAASHGLKLGNQGGFINLAIDYRDREATNRVGEYTARVYSNDVATDEALIRARGFSRKNNMLVGNSAVENFGFMANLEAPITASTKFFANFGINRREGSAAGFYRYPRQTSQVILELYPDGFLPLINSNINDNNFTVGVEGKTKSGWQWDVSSTYGNNSFDFIISNTNNASQFALRTAAPTKFNSGGLKFGQNTNNVNFNKDLTSKISGVKSFNLAMGAEARIDMYEIVAGEEGSWRNYDPASGRAAGAQVFPGFQPSNAVDEKRTILGAYVDAESDISDMFFLSGAVRFENYSDFGSNVAGKLAFRVKASDKFNVRGAVSNGFRAPSMHQRYFNAVSTLFVNTPGGLVPTQAGTFRNDGVVASAFGIPALEAEKSLNLSLGVTANPVKGLSLTLDAYQIDIKDRIILSGDFNRSTNAEVNTLLAAYPDVTSARFFTNGINTITRGIDLVSTYSFKVGKGRLDLSLAANFNKTEVKGNVKKAANLSASDLNLTTLFNLEERGRIEQGQPRNKQVFTINYRVDKIGFLLRNSRFGEVATIFNGTDRTRDEFFSPKLVTDLSVYYKINKNTTFTLGANNIGDVYPDRLKNFLNTSDNRFQYSRNATQFGFNGGYYYGTLQFNF
jgi:iron complex outermembrane recepter protein